MKYRLLGATDELWTNERCPRIENQTICLRETSEYECSINDISKCELISVTNDYKLIKQLDNNKILVSSNTVIKIIEECKNNINSQRISKNALINSKNNCKIIINGTSY